MIKYTNQLINNDLLVQAQGVGNYFEEKLCEEICDTARNARKLALVIEKIRLKPTSSKLKVKALRTAPVTIYAIDESTNEIIGTCSCRYTFINNDQVCYYPNIFIQNGENKLEILKELLFHSFSLMCHNEYILENIDIKFRLEMMKIGDFVYKKTASNSNKYDDTIKKLVDRVPDIFGEVIYQEDQDGNIIIPMLDFDYWPAPTYTTDSVVKRLENSDE